MFIIYELHEEEQDDEQELVEHEFDVQDEQLLHDDFGLLSCNDGVWLGVCVGVELVHVDQPVHLE